MRHEMNTTGRKSKYAAKLSRKRGKGPIDPRWMWWFVRNGAPARRVMTLAEALARVSK